MTISSDTRQAGPYDGNGVTTAFPFKFKVFTTADVQVVQTDPSGIETTLTLTTHYTVTLNADQNSDPGGTVTAVTAPATGYKWTITSDIAPRQSVDLTNLGGFYPAVINSALDKLTILIQQLLNKATRSVKVPISDSTSDITLPTIANRANMFLAFDAAGMPIAASGPASSVPVSTFAATLLDDTSASAMLTTLGVSAFAQTLLDDTTAAAARTTLGAAASTDPVMSGSLILNLSADSIGWFGASGWANSAQNTTPGAFTIFQYGTTAGTGFSGYRARGSIAAVSDSQSGDILNQLYGAGWNNSNWRTAGYITIEQESYSGGSGIVPGRIRIFTTSSGGSTQEQVHVDSTGCVRLAGQTAASGYGNRGDVTLPATGVLRAKNTVKAWCSFDGTAGSISTADAINVSSITDNGTGDYTVNFTNALANANYAIIPSARRVATDSAMVANPCLSGTAAPTTSACRIQTRTVSAALEDSNRVSVLVVGE